MSTDTLTTPETASVPPVASESVTVPPPVEAEAAAPAESAPGPEPEASDSEQPAKKPKVPFSERISQITAARRQAEAERSIALQEVARLRQELEGLRGQPADIPFEQQDANRVREVLKEERLAEKQQEVQTREVFIKEARQAAFLAKVEAAADRMPDLLEKFAAVPVSEAAAEIIAESDRAAEIAYYMANNPREAREIAALPAHLQGARIARIEAKLSAAPQVRKVSQAPAPVPTLKGGTPSPAVADPGTMSMAEYSKWYASRGKK